MGQHGRTARLLQLGAVAFGIFIGAAILAANVGFVHPGHALVKGLPYGDKVSHMLLFGTLALVVNLALGCRTVRLAGFSVLIGSAAVTVFVAIEELSQGYVSARSLDGADFVADLIGIAIASVVASPIHRALFGFGHEARPQALDS